MDETKKSDFPQPQNPPDWAGEALAPQKPPFSASRKEQICAFAMYALALLYVQYLLAPAHTALWLAIFSAGFIAMAEVLFHGCRRPAESWIWLGCMLVILAALLRNMLQADRCSTLFVTMPEHAIPDSLSIAALHLLAVYWALCRAGRLTGGESGHLLPLDALYAFLILPFRHFFLRIRCAVSALKPQKKARSSIGAIAAAIAAALAVIVLLSMAAAQLSAADDTFRTLLDRLRSHLTFNWNTDLLLRLLLSLPVGAYLFGLLAGLGRQTPDAMRAHGTRVTDRLPRLRVVPDSIWIAALGLFSMLYLVFFVIQGQYLFGAFSRTLPESFTVAEYARQGFFELCRVMAINFTLFWLVTRTGKQKQPLIRWMAAALLIESMLFAVIALSKLSLYISCFGFTPRRLQSTWLVCVLFFGCVCALYTHLTGKKSMRCWMIFGAVTLALLHLI